MPSSHVRKTSLSRLPQPVPGGASHSLRRQPASIARYVAQRGATQEHRALVQYAQRAVFSTRIPRPVSVCGGWPGCGIQPSLRAATPTRGLEKKAASPKTSPTKRPAMTTEDATPPRPARRAPSPPRSQRQAPVPAAAIAPGSISAPVPASISASRNKILPKLPQLSPPSPRITRAAADDCTTPQLISPIPSSAASSAFSDSIFSCAESTASMSTAPSRAPSRKASFTSTLQHIDDFFHPKAKLDLATDVAGSEHSKSVPVTPIAPALAEPHIRPRRSGSFSMLRRIASQTGLSLNFAKKQSPDDDVACEDGDQSPVAVQEKRSFMEHVLSKAKGKQSSSPPTPTQAPARDDRTRQADTVDLDMIANVQHKFTTRRTKAERKPRPSRKYPPVSLTVRGPAYARHFRTSPPTPQRRDSVASLKIEAAGTPETAKKASKHERASSWPEEEVWDEYNDLIDHYLVGV